MTERLTVHQEEKIVSVMSAIATRCQGDTDEMVGLTGQEVESLVFAFGGAFEGSQLRVLHDPEWSLRLREHWFIGNNNPRDLIENARQLQTIFTVVLAGERRSFRDSLRG